MEAIWVTVVGPISTSTTLHLASYKHSRNGVEVNASGNVLQHVDETHFLIIKESRGD
jgi:hypothetical protein